MDYSGPLSLGWHKALFVSTRGTKYGDSVYQEVGGRACHCKITVPRRHVVPVRLIRAMCGLFRAT